MDTVLKYSCYHLESHTTSFWEVHEMVAEVLHPVDVDPNIWRSVQGLDQGSGPVVHTHPGNDLGTAHKDQEPC